jgi:hypothetical protein
MKLGALNGTFPGKHYSRMQNQQGLQGINRTRMRQNVAQLQALGSQILSTGTAASEQTSTLAIQQLQTRVAKEADALVKTRETQRLDILA